MNEFLPRNDMLQRGICYGPVSVCPSVCLSVTSRCSIKMAKHIVMQTTSYVWVAGKTV